MDRQRLLIVGAHGFLGMYASQVAKDLGNFEVIRGGRDLKPRGHVQSELGMETDTLELDISNTSSVNRAFHQSRPDAVLLLAAISDIDRCEQSPQDAFDVNVRGVENIANACARNHSRLLFSSSAAVFDGTKQQYSEDDLPAPISVYGKTKLWGENIVQGLLPSAVILRFALVLGFARRSGTNSLLDGVIQKWQEGKPVGFSTQERRNPIDAGTLSRLMIDMIADQTLNGIYHVGSSDGVSRYELALRLATRVGVPAELVRPQREAVLGRAPRGENHFLLIDKILSACKFRPQTTDEIIERCFS